MHSEALLESLFVGEVSHFDALPKPFLELGEDWLPEMLQGFVGILRKCDDWLRQNNHLSYRYGIA